jgi:hypothetical protein
VANTSSKGVLHGVGNGIITTTEDGTSRHTPVKELAGLMLQVF